MHKAFKVILLPTPEQEILFWKSAGVARWAYNYYLEERQKSYIEYESNGRTGQKPLTGGEVRKQITQLKKTTCPWLNEISSNVPKQAVKEAENAVERWFGGICKKPKFRTKRSAKPSFYVNYESLKRRNGGFHGEKIGFVRTTQQLPKLKKGQHYLSPRITHDGFHWWLSASYEVEPLNVELTDEIIGIDLGIKELAVCSNGKVYPNINKSERVIMLEKRLNREQRKLSRMIEMKIVDYKVVSNKRYPIYERPLVECNNIQKQKKVIAKIYRRLTNIRNNYIHQTTTEIVKTKPSKVVMEDLNVKGMIKNKHLSKAIAKQKFFEFRRQMEYKCEFYGIKFILVDRWYPSSKTCSCCGYIKKDLKLKDRTFKCPNCGNEIDRDLNAAINLANYKSA